MMKINYTNPMSKTYQYEYAMYLAVADLFHSVVCKSLGLKTLQLYFADLVTESKITGTPNYRRQDELKEEMKKVVERDVIGKIAFPGINQCMAEVTIRKNPDETHDFTFSDGIYGFTVRLNGKIKGGAKIKILIENRSATENEENRISNTYKTVGYRTKAA